MNKLANTVIVGSRAIPGLTRRPKDLDVITTDEGFRALVAQRRTPYGDGKAGQRIAEVLRSVELGRGLLDKKWVQGVR